MLAVNFNSSHAYENYTSITRTLTVEVSSDVNLTASEAEDEESSASFTVDFITENEELVQFQTEILGENLDGNYQVRD